MYVMEGTTSYIHKCSQIGEAKLFGYILATYNKTDSIWTNTKTKREAAMQLYELKESTIFQYLKLLVASGLLIKMGRSEYKVNPEYIEFGSQIKP